MDHNKSQIAIQYSGEFDFSLFIYAKDQIEEFEFTIQKIRELLFSPVAGDEQLEYIRQLWLILISKIPLPAINSDVNFIVRARPNDEGEIFQEESDISYNSRNIDAITPNRFNAERESVFYGSLPSDKQERFIAAISIESFKELITETNKKEIQYYTFSKWMINTPFTLINLCFEQNAYNEHPGLRGIVNNTIEELRQKLPETSFIIINKFWNFISELSGSRKINEQHYRITTSFFQALRFYYTSTERGNVNGLIFPSPMVYGQAINVVLMPAAVDKFLKLQDVFMFKYVRDKENPKLYETAICSKPTVVENGKLNITEINWGRSITEFHY